MGAEFLSRTRPTIRKHIDKQRVALATPGLFSVTPGEQPRISVATISAGATVTGGETVIVEVQNGAAKLRRGNVVVGALDNPSVQIITTIENSGGAATGIVQRVHSLSGKADVTLC